MAYGLSVCAIAVLFQRFARSARPHGFRVGCSGAARAARSGALPVGPPSFTQGHGRTYFPCRSAGWAPAATRSATAARGSRPVTRLSPTKTASAPDAA